MKIVIVDDQRTVVQALTRMLELGRHTVVAVTDWLQANRVVHRESPQLVVLDQNLGSFQGSHLVRPLRLFFPQLKIVVLSGENVRETALEAGADHFLEKRHMNQLPRLVRLLDACRRPTACQLAVGSTGFPRCRTCPTTTRRLRSSPDIP